MHFCNQTQGQSGKTALPESARARLEDILKPYRRGLVPGLQVLIRQHGETLFEDCIGYANLEHRLPLTPDTRLHIASISKQFTVILLYLLVEDGLLELDAPLERYLPGVLAFPASPTLRQLANNCSGIRDHWELFTLSGLRTSDDIRGSDVEHLHRRQTRLNFMPGERYLYSNSGFYFLARVLEKVSGESFGQVLAHRVLQPLGLKNTLVRENVGQLVDQSAYSYHLRADGQPVYAPLTLSMSGPTSVNSCARDLARLLDEYQKPQVFSPELVRFLLTPAQLADGSDSPYCGGLMTHVWHGHRCYGHSGANAAYRGQMLWLPDEELQVIALSNTDHSLMGELSQRLAAAVLGEEADAFPPVPASVCPHTGAAASALTDTADRACKSDGSAACTAAKVSSSVQEPLPGAYASLAADVPQLIRIRQKGPDRWTCENDAEGEGEESPLRPEGDFYRLGVWDRLLRFHSHGLTRYTRAAAQEFQLCQPLSSERALELGLRPGLYRQEDCDSYLRLTSNSLGELQFEQGRRGAVPLYEAADGSLIFSFGEEACFRLCPLADGSWELNGNRVLHLPLRRLAD